MIRLPLEVNPLFQHWLETHFPERAARVMARIRDMRGGADNVSAFGERMRGTGIWADLVRQRMHKTCDRLGLARQRLALDFSQFQRVPKASGATAVPAQASLF
jgi:DNA repair photolyase